jgi:putative ABC transport system substrate-binding protein
MRRRKFIALIGGAATATAAWPIAARAQRPKLLRVGLAQANPRTFVTMVTFERRLRELGYVEGQNLAIEFIHFGSRAERADEAMRELVRRKVDVIITSGGESNLKSAMRATSRIPIVMIAVNFDPVEGKFVTSIARPTGNVTGLYFRRPELVEKQMEVFAETLPQRRRLGILWDAVSSPMFAAAERAAPSLQLELRSLRLQDPPYDFAGAFAKLADSGADMLFVLSSIYFNEHRSALAQLAIHHKLPTMFVSNLYVEAGGLMSYGPSLLGMWRRSADYVDRLAKGAKPADLPIEQPTKFDLVINARTAKALGLAIPATVLARADEVIE